MVGRYEPVKNTANMLGKTWRKFILSLSPLLVLSAVVLGLAPLVAFAWQQGGSVYPDAYAWRVLWFTLLQAGLSTLLSVVPAIFVARALARRSFWGRRFLLALFAVPLSLPVIVAVFGLTAVYGTEGLGRGLINLYGLGGILLAHVFFNLPLATRMLLEPLTSASVENHRLAAQLGFSDSAVLRHVDWPILKPVLSRVAALVFLLCASSFVIVLLFGGPQATTLEVAIFQSLRMDFDVTRALTLTSLQIVLSVVLVFAAAKALTMPTANFTLSQNGQRFDGISSLSSWIDYSFIAFAAAVVLPVLISVVSHGLQHVAISTVLFTAMMTSAFIAVISCCLALPLTWGLAVAQLRVPGWRGCLTALSLAGFIVPPAVLATGWFLVFKDLNAKLPVAIVLIAAMNALMALPFLMTVLAPALQKSAQQNDRLCEYLGISGWHRFKLIDLADLRAPLVQCLLLSLVLSMGDLTAVTLLGTQGLVTLPALVQQQMGHYQSDAAGGTALILAAICLGLTLLAQRFAK